MKRKLSVLANIKKLKTLVVLSVFGIVLAGNVQAQTQTRKPVSKHVKDKIKKDIFHSTSSGARIVNDTVEMMMDDGFIKVEYVHEYMPYDGTSKHTHREIYTTDGKQLYIVGLINTAKHIGRVRKFPKKMEQTFSDYIVLGLEKKKSDGGHTVYNAYSKDGELVGWAESLKELYKKIRDKQAKDKEKAMQAEQAEIKKSVPRIKQVYTR